MNPDTYVEEEHWSFVTTVAYMRVALGTLEGYGTQL
jgi:hypothetical protein